MIHDAESFLTEARRLVDAERSASSVPAGGTIGSTELVHEAYIEPSGRGAAFPSGRIHFPQNRGEGGRRATPDYLGWTTYVEDATMIVELTVTSEEITGG